MSVEGDRSPGGGLHQLTHERHARAAADEEHPADIGRGDAGRADGALEGLRRLVDPWPDHGLELAASEAYVCLQPGHRHRDRRIGVGGEGLLGPPALRSQSGLGGQGLGVGAIGTRHCAPEHGVDVGHHGLVEIDAAEALHALGVADQLESILGAPHQGGIEGAAAKVVDCNDLTRCDLLLAGIGDGGGLGFGQQLHPGGVEACEAGSLAKHTGLVLPIVGRVGEHHYCGCFAFLLGGPLHDVAQEVSHHRLDWVGDPADDHRNRVAEAALELASYPSGFDVGPPFGGITDDDLTVFAHHHDRWDLGSIGAQLKRLGRRAAGDRRC